MSDFDKYLVLFVIFNMCLTGIVFKLAQFNLKMAAKDFDDQHEFNLQLLGLIKRNRESGK